MRSVLVYSVFTAAITVPLCHGQSVVGLSTFKDLSMRGFHLHGAWVFSGYSTTPYPVGLGSVPVGLGRLGPDVNYGAGAGLGWQYHHDRWNFALGYSASYRGLVQNSDANGFSQSLSLSADRKLSRRWTLGFSASGSDTTMAEFVFQPSTLAQATQTATTFDDFAAGFSVGQFSNGPAASVTSAPLLESPTRGLLVGNRVLSYSGATTLNFAYSSRLTFHFGAFGAGGYHRVNATDELPERDFASPRSIGANAGVGFNYMLSPRTQIGFDGAEQRSQNRYQAANISTAYASFGRKMGMHWFLALHGGGAYTQSIRQDYPGVKARSFIGGASVGFQTHRHKLAGSYDRLASDRFGLAVGTVTSLSAAWNWHFPGSAWNVSASFAQQYVRNAGFASLSGWEAAGGLSRNLSSQTRMSLHYVYLSSAGHYLGGPMRSLEIHSVMASLSWSPPTQH